ncbi:MAG: hypothetical protein ACP5N7_04880 [Candidatus Pacearchaeota archaeon]
MSRLIFSSLLILLFLEGCNKKDDTSTAKTRTQLLTEKDWILISQQQKLSSSSGTYTEVFNQLDACYRDNRYVFTKVGMYEENEGSLRCSGNSHIIISGTWSFQQNESKIRVVVPSETSIANIETLSSTTLTITFSAIKNGVSYDAKQTFSH